MIMYMILYDVLFFLNSVVCAVCNEMLSNVLPVVASTKKLYIVDLNVNLEASY